MEKTLRHKVKNKKSTGKPKPTKKRKSDGPTCSMFLAELSRKLALKKKQEEESPKNIVQTIIESITNALPIKFFKKRTEVKEPPLALENLQIYAPELLPNDKIDIVKVGDENVTKDEVEIKQINLEQNTRKTPFKVPKMPVVNSEVLKIAAERSKKREDASVNTGVSNDVAVELAKHVNTLKKISLIAEEFNKKTAKNLKEIVDSVQEELIKKLELVQAEQALEAAKNKDANQKP
ncbi:uncharacterized protein LOC106714467 [Papilio machaon]|uniref:uncharacterized protein LOC106714467 n=1 Tax=Papilio machaon TaxID=76193 RepID=UPI001E664F54|nr:uncharacterized protein LOC106714467 [Papilio machaon]